MNKKIVIMLTTIVIAIVACVALVFSEMFIDLFNNKKLKEAVLELEGNEVTLEELVPFEWENVYTFAPYTSKKRIEKIIGFKSDKITETVNEAMVHLIFTKGNKIVCSICGYAENLGYGIYFTDSETDFSKITFGDNFKFTIEKEDKIIILSR